MAVILDYAKIREAADFATVLRHYGFDFPPGRTQLKLRCPFHEEGTPSLSVNLKRKIYKCFGCNESGNVLSFVQRMEKLGQGRDPGPYKAALRLAEICQLTDIEKEKPKGGARTPAQRPEKPLQRDSSAQTGKPASASSSPLCVAPDASERSSTVAQGDVVDTNRPLNFSLRLEAEHPYLRERGLTPETIAEFGLGFCSRGMMKGRVCVPIHNEHGELVAYAGRWVGADETIPEHEGKWKLPPRFEKSRVLFNLHRVEEPRHLVLLEGFFGAIVLHALGVSTVALMGRALSQHQLELLQGAGTRYVTLLLDGDEPGRQAVATLMGQLAHTSLFVRAVMLPEGTQPDTLPVEELLARLDCHHLKPWPSALP